MDTNSIIDRIKQITGAKNQKEIANILNLSQSDFSNRKKRETLLTPIINWAMHENVNLNWLITGRENVIDIAHKNVIAKFKDKKTARDINISLVEAETLNPASLQRIALYIRGVVDGLKDLKSTEKEHTGSEG